MSRSGDWPTEADDASDASDDAADAGVIGTLVGGRYRVVKKLGQGGMGAVFLAHQEALGRDVALKIVRGELARVPRHVERFRREAKTLSQLVHPNIVALYDFGEEQATTLWFAMELLRGESLRDRLRARGALPVGESMAIARDMCAALVAAHDRGVMHRDLKPDNVMVLDGPRPFVKLVDFGIAKAVGDARVDDGASLTQTGTVVGTPGYVPREISVDGIHDDPRSDLYSLGVTWFEMLTGEPPFFAQTAVGLMMKHASDTAPRAIDVAPHVPPRLSALVDRLLAKDRNARPASAHEVLALLDELERPIAVQPPVTDAFSRLPKNEQVIVVTQPFLDAPVAAPPLASAVTVVRNDETPPSSPHVPQPHVERVASVRLRPLLVGGALACVAAVVAIAFAMDERAPRTAPPARVERAAAPVVQPAPVVEPAPIVKPAPAAPMTPRASVVAPRAAPIGAAATKREAPKLIDGAPKLLDDKQLDDKLLDDKPKLMD